MKAHFERIGHTITVEHANRSCLDKRRYASRNDARDAAAKMAHKYPSDLKTKPYRCTLCQGFHLFTLKPPVPKKRKRSQ